MRYLKYIFICALSAALTGALLLYYGLPAPEIRSPDSLDVLNSWHDTLHVIYNAFFSWRLNPILLRGAKLLSADNYFTFSIFLALAVFITGLAAYCLKRDTGFIPSLIISCLAPLSILLLFLLDSIIIFSFCAVFWTALAAESYLSQPGLINKHLLVLLALSAFTVFSANQVAFFICAVAFLLSYENVPNAPLNKVKVLAAIFFGLLVFSVNAPVPETPEYPQMTHVVPDDNIPGYIMPLYGATPPVPLINRHALKEHLSLPSIAFFLFALFIFASNYKRKSSRIALFFALCCLLEASFSDKVSAVAPIYSLNRTVPGLIYLPLLPLTFVGGLIFLISGSLRFRLAEVSASTAFLIVPLINTAFIDAPQVKVTGKGLLIKRLAPLEVLSRELNAGTITNEKYNEFYRRLVSPSYNLIAEQGIHVLKDYNFHLKNVHLRGSEIANFASSAGFNQQLMAQMFDRRMRSRWSPQAGKQRGDEWLALGFKTPRSIWGVYMPAGNFKSDFPRGVEVQAAEECDPQKPESGSYNTVFRADIWEGNVTYTPDRFPYYDDQAEVRIIFSKEVKASCLKILQIGETPHFDWSIAELELIEYVP